jgi:hypothetical protein
MHFLGDSARSWAGLMLPEPPRREWIRFHDAAEDALPPLPPGDHVRIALILHLIWQCVRRLEILESGAVAVAKRREIEAGGQLSRKAERIF